MRIDRVDRAEDAVGRRTARERICQVAVLHRHRRHERRQVDLREDDIAFRLVVEDADARADDGLVVQ